MRNIDVWRDRLAKYYSCRTPLTLRNKSWRQNLDIFTVSSWEIFNGRPIGYFHLMAAVYALSTRIKWCSWNVITSRLLSNYIRHVKISMRKKSCTYPIQGVCMACWNFLYLPITFSIDAPNITFSIAAADRACRNHHSREKSANIYKHRDQFHKFVSQFPLIKYCTHFLTDGVKLSQIFWIWRKLFVQTLYRLEKFFITPLLFIVQMWAMFLKF